jgi:beta-glucosidase
MLRGVYPADLLADTAHIVDWEALVHDGDLELIRQPINILGINYYNSALVRRHVGDGPMVQEDGHKVTAHSPWIGADDVEFPATPGLHTAMGWNIDPAAFTAMLIDLHQRYPEFPISITENGAAFDDDVTYEAGVERVHDPLRIQYLHDHVEAMGQAMDAGVDIRGYFAWSLMDNFEWAYGFSKRFGIVRVDYPTGERAWKDSAFWYRQLATTNQLPAVTDVPA